ncbi:MAG: phosphoribosylanthranilate isomerase [Bacteroidaceae bacterium]|nr:phosphoribosylanthranilate isomerase [Bacteroidaceae bacterium]
MKRLVKVCGMTQGDNIREVEALGIDLMGFIFYEKSPRCVRQKPDYLPVHAQRVGVFVNASYEEMVEKAASFGLTHIQLHGNESPALCRKLKEVGFKVIKAFLIAEDCDLESTESYQGVCDYFLFDTKTPAFGGSGQSFDWDILSHYTGATPFLLSGGIGLESVEALKRFSHPALAGYDLNSKFEVAPGIKEIEKVLSFFSSLQLEEKNQKKRRRLHFLR